MQLLDFNGCELSNRSYGGLSGAKLGIVYHGEYYLLKFPKGKSSGDYKNVEMSYSNSPICEYLGSHIYELLDFPTHKTLLGTRNGKTVVACKDFRQKEHELLDLQEFREIKTTFLNELSPDEGTSGNGTNLEETLMILREHPMLRRHPEARERFWDMLIVDAFIGNSDRNNGNWGMLVSFDGHEELAPVYDNGACLNNKWDDKKMQSVMDSPVAFANQAYKGVICSYTKKNGRHRNPFHILEKTQDKVAKSEIKRLVPMIQECQNRIDTLFNDLPLLSSTQIAFYQKILRERTEKALIPIYEKQVLHKTNSRGGR